MAKEAAKNVVQGNDKKNTDEQKQESEMNKKVNLEIEQSADLDNSQKIAELETKSEEFADAGLTR
jgi:hypothetical protein